MAVWISAGMALLLWGLLVYFFGGQFRHAGRQIESERAEKEAAELFETEGSIVTAMAEAPDNPAYVLKWIELATLSNNFPELTRRSRVMVSRFPKQRAGYIWLARGLWQSGDVAGSKKVLRQLTRRYGDVAAATEILVAQAFEAKDYARSAKLATRLRKTYPEGEDAYRNEVRALLALGAFAQAEQVVLLAEARFPDSKLVTQLWDWLEEALAADEAPASGTPAAEA